MTSKPTVLIFGVGPRTGTLIANKFAGAGYQVAATGRSVEDGPIRDGYLNIKGRPYRPSCRAGRLCESESAFWHPTKCRRV